MSLLFRIAVRDDLPSIVDMLADDELGSQRECNKRPLADEYFSAFDAIAPDPNNELVIAELDGAVKGVVQLTYIPYLTYQGSWRALIEGVRVHKSARSVGIGEAMINWCIDQAQERGCVLIQLTTDKKRPDAIRFYERLGFRSSHEGMKMWF